ILLTIPTTSCIAERSFSTLRRMKTYLRSTMGQSRLNSLAILHIHCDITETLDLNKIVNTFICANAVRRSKFAVVNSNKHAS
ncbi:Zinc finger MYM-type protein 1, partial [Cyphomyrmex costatus]